MEDVVPSPGWLEVLGHFWLFLTEYYLQEILTMNTSRTWFKIQMRPHEIDRIKRLAKGRGRDMSAYIRWLLDRDERDQQKNGPKQESLFGL